MIKKIIIFLIVLILGISFIGVKKISMERSRRRGLMEVHNTLYVDVEGTKTRTEILSIAKELRANGQFSQARRVIEENIDNARENLEIDRYLDELDKNAKVILKKYSMNACLSDEELRYYYENIDDDNVNNLDIKSETNRFIFVDIQEQMTSIYKKINNHWVLEKKIMCATGQEETPTPVGVFKLSLRDEWFYSPKFDRGAKYYIGFKGNEYLFHSVPYYSDKRTIWEERLGVPMSYGCIRHSTENQKWIYDNVLDGTTVIIY